MKEGRVQCFGDLHASVEEISTFQSSLNCAIEKLPLSLHLEVINLECNDLVKGKFERT